MRLDIRYRTSFTYENLVRESQNELRACPTSDEQQELIAYRVHTSPGAKVYSFTDYWGTRVDSFGLRLPHVALEVVAEASVETFQRPLLTVAPHLDALRDPSFVDTRYEYLQPSPHARWGRGIETEAIRQRDFVGDDVVSLVLALHRVTGARLTYARGTTDVGIEVEDVLAQGKGVCQDYAHLAVAFCRSQGIPARYVSGYLFTRDDSTRADVEDCDVVNVQTHAWFEAAIPGFGWLALDPTNQQEVGVRHVKIGHGRDYDDVQPLRGIFSGGATPSVDPTVEIRRVRASAAPTGERTTPDPHLLNEQARSRQARELEAIERAQHQQQQQQQ
jgi:transglutaminase-like putative cysteine protease